MSKNLGGHNSTILVLNCKNLGGHVPPGPPVPTALVWHMTTYNLKTSLIDQNLIRNAAINILVIRFRSEMVMAMNFYERQPSRD